MVRRLFSLVLALVIAGAPVAIETCLSNCASVSPHSMSGHHMEPRDAHDQATSQHGSCHDVPPAPHHLSPQPSSCDHDGTATVPSVPTARNTDSVLLSSHTVPLIDNLVFVRTSTFVPTRQSSLTNPIEIHLGRALRI